jgi:hypothetical protein
VGIYLETFFPPGRRGSDDIVLTGQAVRDAAVDQMIFADLMVARHAASDPGVIAQLREILRRVRPDFVLVEQPWCWLPLREALKTLDQPVIVYSSHNIEWRMRPELYRLGLRRPGADALVAATHALEMELWRRADLVLSISDLERDEIARATGRDDIVYVAPVSDIAEGKVVTDGRFAAQAMSSGIRYAALLGSAYWPNNEGFQEMFSEGLGFLRPNEEIWVGGELGFAVAADPRYLDYKTINDTRMRQVGSINDDEKAQFFGASHCVIVPVCMGGGSKLKTADALGSGRAVISTPHGVEGYGSVIGGALDRGLYVADSPAEFRRLVIRALREGLPGCGESIRAVFRQQRLTETIGPLFRSLSQRPAAKPELVVS